MWLRDPASFWKYWKAIYQYRVTVVSFFFLFSCSVLTIVKHKKRRRKMLLLWAPLYGKLFGSDFGAGFVVSTKKRCWYNTTLFTATFVKKPTEMTILLIQSCHQKPHTHASFHFYGVLRKGMWLDVSSFLGSFLSSKKFGVFFFGL